MMMYTCTYVGSTRIICYSLIVWCNEQDNSYEVSPFIITHTGTSSAFG